MTSRYFTTSGVSLSLNKPTSSNTVGWGGVPDRAVEGGTSGRYTDGFVLCGIVKVNLNLNCFIVNRFSAIIQR